MEPWGSRGLTSHTIAQPHDLGAAARFAELLDADDLAVKPKLSAARRARIGRPVHVRPRARPRGYLTDPLISPPMKYLPRMMYTSRVGNDAMSAPAMAVP